jgi:hypothetical protein
MPNKWRLATHSFEPEVADAMRAAYRMVCAAPDLKEVGGALAEKIVEIARAGETDPNRLYARALQQVSHYPAVISGRVKLSGTDRWNRQVGEFLAQRFSEAPQRQAYFVGLWEKFHSLGLPNANFVAELTNGDAARFCQRVWEMQLAIHLNALGYQLTSPAHGPDFRFEHRGLTVWVEAVSPEPKGVPAHWLAPPVRGKANVRTMPHEEILLRWTAAFKEKYEKLQAYRAKGIVRANHAYVIAINGSQLNGGSGIPLIHGISRLPLPVETVYPAGPLGVPIDPNTGEMGEAAVTPRYSLVNANGSPVGTTPFIDPTYSGVSSVIGFSSDHCAGPSLPAYIAHNLMACVPTPQRLFGPTCEEWVPSWVGDKQEEFELFRLPAALS